ncbi:hypothetical protein [Paraburkholderia ultramafica]|uniref:hypothetical protein n=1 Tax=Paraburkholderia ultramafica TaxID=1544867 RepID=UPI001582A1E5|nr:hypothetical protein [Paraburkholderia ultramafica]
MFDAEIAATLLNRWDEKLPTFCNYSSLGLLHEGKLTFHRHIGKLCADAVADD